MVRAQEPLGGVGKTALGVAVVRARESRRDDRLFADPYAQAFLDAVPSVRSQRSPNRVRSWPPWGQWRRWARCSAPTP
jgi:O-methyltransferase involved in polyketide biosynthesis